MKSYRGSWPIWSVADALVCGGDAGIRAAQRATPTIPIVGITDDMVGSGLVRSLAKPGGNTTGISILATELDGKRLEMLIGLVPEAHRMAALADLGVTGPKQLETLMGAARARAVQLLVYRITKREEIIGTRRCASVVCGQSHEAARVYRDCWRCTGLAARSARGTADAISGFLNAQTATGFTHLVAAFTQGLNENWLC
jgi:hypothetical protein